MNLFARELPPTAGLPLQASDFVPGGGDLRTILANQLGTPPLQPTCSGTHALLIALRTLRKRAPHRDTVILPAYTCPLVPIAVHSLGLRVQLCDTRHGHFDFDPGQLKRLADARTLAILPTHLGGRIADVELACEIARSAGAWVIEDAAQALGARVGSHSVGLRGDIGFFSLAAGKGLSLHEGGLLVSRDDELRAALAEHAAQHVRFSLRWELLRSVQLMGLAACYRPWLLSLVYGNPLRSALRRGDVEAAVGDVFALDIPQHRVSRWRLSIGARAAQRLPAFLQAGRMRALQLRVQLAQLPVVEVVDGVAGTGGTWPLLMLLLPSQRARDAALADLWPRGLGVSRMFIHALPDYAYLRGIVPPTDVPNARDFAARMLTLGNSAWQTREETAQILQVLARA
ncbi:MULTISPECIES: DegT/DnrJ/EryC1/StrS family aminotransferase [Stenotrophomonas]|uniref:DegT/DnrJ/EryC1/StrS family aminotransferase n=1 Tax=Stenotrophomonas TaxID=40323 RepID=UPI00201CEEE5|nr:MULTISPECIES: DegT/DnrJ/EryC1/StrS family aminotransferase [Stenotrophomonas]MBN5025563.1 DegT/DnrJ/EryC1/StrS family aminotransferase [Stenotrophomonas maltophilia]MDH1272702.1 DegT/DnrJ/EryC1/StrS family aminotransferase [Stenotrophomonas sp. GD03937]MDH1484684.1 DegT/DnrJ/EryC1/StrS family aminotransferase [Stenotrophomonas sp. GD03712]UQY97607.1 DegT/DnrJ/EryC1/StrS family aminotransferase [Stenotrophomonas maltophilia]WON69923.1 DegT/DnrJ/EryC1/StrS family aminotransferase [Stenotropho